MEQNKRDELPGDDDDDDDGDDDQDNDSDKRVTPPGEEKNLQTKKKNS